MLGETLTLRNIPTYPASTRVTRSSVLQVWIFIGPVPVASLQLLRKLYRPECIA